MGRTLKTIKVIFTVDVEKFRKNVRAAETAINSASKKIEEANQGVIDSNEKITQSSKGFAKANGQAAEANEKVTAAITNHEAPPPIIAVFDP